MYSKSLYLLMSIGCSSSPSEDTSDVDTTTIRDTGSEEEFIEPEAVVSKVPVLGERTALIELIAVDQNTSIALSGFQTLLNDPVGWSIQDETKSTPLYLGSYEYVDGLVLDESSTALLLDGEIQVLNGSTLEASPLNDLLPIPPEKLFGTEESLWFVGAGRLYTWENDRLSEVTVSDGNIQGFVFGPAGVHALTLPDLLLIEKGMEDTQIVDYRSDILPLDMVFDSSGTLWVSDGSAILHQRNGNRIWSALDLEEPIVKLMGHETSSDLWVKTETSVFHHRGGEFYQVSLPEGEWLDVDEYGRLLILTESGVQRVSIERTVVVVGARHEQALDGIQELTFLPMLEESLISLNVWIDQTGLTLDDYRTVVDANDYPAGTHTLRMVATDDEGTTVTEVPFVIGELPDMKWEDDIDALSQRHCNDCHGETSFLPLHAAQQWEENISLILSEVLGNEMPKGGPYLSAEEVQMIRGWQNGGFQ